MKKIIALAVASAFVAPVMAADVTISGDFITDFRDTDGTSSVNNDHDVNFTASTETANGWTVSGTVGMKGDATDDGVTNITVKGPFGSVSAGNVNGTTDRIDAIADAAIMIGTDTGSESDANILYTLPKFVEGLTVAVSYAADGGSNGAAELKEGTGYGIDYSFGPVSVHYANIDNEDDTNENSIGLKAGIQGISFAYLAGEQEDTVGSVTEDKAFMVSYEMGDVFVFFQNIEVEDANDAVSNDITAYGVQYSVGGGVKLFAEMSEDDKDSTADTTSVGIAFKF